MKTSLLKLVLTWLFTLTLTTQAQVWRFTDSMLESREQFAHTALKDGRILVTGGYYQEGSGFPVRNTCEIYDPKTESWSRTGSMLIRRRGHTCTLLPDGKVLVTGGPPLVPTVVTWPFASLSLPFQLP